MASVFGSFPDIDFESDRESETSVEDRLLGFLGVLPANLVKAGVSLTFLAFALGAPLVVPALIEFVDGWDAIHD